MGLSLILSLNQGFVTAPQSPWLGHYREVTDKVIITVWSQSPYSKVANEVIIYSEVTNEDVI